VWLPEIVIEVVSEESRARDYGEKPEDYLHFGVQEYWIVDAPRGVMTVNRRSRGQWKSHEFRAGQRLQTHRLPGFDLDVAAILDA
jgi:Uma2 family endonuclease